MGEMGNGLVLIGPLDELLQAQVTFRLLHMVCLLHQRYSLGVRLHLYLQTTLKQMMHVKKLKRL